MSFVSGFVLENNLNNLTIFNSISIHLCIENSTQCTCYEIYLHCLQDFVDTLSDLEISDDDAMDQLKHLHSEPYDVVSALVLCCVSVLMFYEPRSTIKQYRKLLFVYGEIVSQFLQIT